MSEAEADLCAEAEAIANKTRPVSKITPLTGGFMGLITAVFADEVLTTVAGLGRDVDPAWLVIWVLGFAGPFLYLRQAQQKHLAERKRAYENLQAAAQETTQETIQETTPDAAGHR
jgi:hypothetical protein